MAATLANGEVAFLRDNAFPAVVTTLRTDGSPHSTVVWIDADEGHVLFNTARGRAKERHLLRNPRVSVVTVDPSDQYRWIGVTGTAELTEEGADDHIDRLAKKYLGVDSYPNRSAAETRVIVRITPERVESRGIES